MSSRITGALFFSASIAFSVIVTTVSTNCSSNTKRNKEKKSESIDAVSLASKEEQSTSGAKPLSCKTTPIESATIATVIVNKTDKPVEKEAKVVVAEPVVNIMSQISIEEPVKKTEKAVSSAKKTTKAVLPASPKTVSPASPKAVSPALPKAKVEIEAAATIQGPEASFSGSASVDLSAAIDVEDDAPCFTVSAPGKALIAGGYLVLEPSNIGITISSTSRFYSTVALLKTPHDDLSKYQLTIVVESPQFNTSFEYQYDIHFDSLVPTSEATNVFVEKCLAMVLSYTKESLGYGVLSDVIASVSSEGKLGVKLRADNDFYSQVKELKARGLPLASYSLEKLPKFNPCPVDANGNTEVVKTGMGSSAALATSLVGALLVWFGVVRLGAGSKNIAEDRRVLHNLAQLAHAVAQGKIGSGFDVAAAVYGTQIYKRFSPEGLNSCLDKATPYEIYSTVNDRSLWTQTITCFSLPPQMDLLMGDVCGGSSSVSMAREVLKWRTDKPDEAYKIWEALADVNEDIQGNLNDLWGLAEADPEDYAECLSRASKSTYAQWIVQSAPEAKAHEVTNRLVILRKLFGRMRELLRVMGKEAGVEIEPPSQTLLADKTETMQGVLCAGVPGAGGHDAIFAIVLSYSARSQVEDMWSGWGSDGTAVCPLLLSAEGGLDGGVRVEEEMAWA